MEPHDPIFGRRRDKPGHKPLCACIDCAEERQAEYQETLRRLSVEPSEVIIGDANVQKVIRQVTAEIIDLLVEYDEEQSLVGSLIVKKLNDYHRVNY